MIFTYCFIMTTRETQLSYSIHDFSSFSGDFSPKLILVDRPFDQKSRWLSDGNRPPQFVTLKVLKPAIVRKILFGKYEKIHPCNIRKLKVYGGLDPEHVQLLLESDLKNDNQSETLDLQCTVNGQPFPCEYIKIVPLQSWGGGFNFSIWHVQLWGISEDGHVEEALTKLMEFKEKEAVRLCLKHLRQYDYMEAFEALQKKSKVLLEDSILTKLHNELVTRAEFKEAERTISEALHEGYLDSYISQQLIQAKWTCVSESIKCVNTQHATTPEMRGGHQMCIDKDMLYLYGGWDGSKELGDLWQCNTKTQQWRCLSLDTAQEGGPGRRSCHAMSYNSSDRAFYLLGGYVETSSPPIQYLPCSFYLYYIDSNNWRQLSHDTHKEGGPHMIYDHQMCYDPESAVLYVLGGTIVGTELCSGLYAYHTVEHHWLCLFPDQLDSNFSEKPPYFPRSGHAMLFHSGLNQLFILGGHRQQEILSDMLTYHVRSGEASILFNGKDTTIPMTDMTLRASLDFTNNMICLNGLNKPEDLETKSSNSMWLYDISSFQWSQVNTIENLPCPVPRYAHSFVYDSQRLCYFMFGGRGSHHAKENSSMRLDDFWKVQIVQQSRESLLKECQLSLRKQRYVELSVSNPVEAITFLQTSIAELIDHNDQQDSKEYRELTSALFSSDTKWSVNKVVSLKKMRSDLFDRIASYFPNKMAQPTNNLIDYISLS